MQSRDSVHAPVCRFCGSVLEHTFVDLGMSPLCESFLSAADINKMEPFYPLKVFICSKCLLVQLEEFVSPEGIFREYAYFSSYADSWVQHAKDYTDMIVERLGLGRESLAIELASNDGYLLQHFVAKGVPCLGIEPAANVAETAIARDVPTLVKFFNAKTASDLAREGKQADLVIGNNVLAQVPDLNDFVEGIRIVLKPEGVATLEFPHVLRLIERNQFDTIYHEHFSYFSLTTVEKVFAAHGLTLFDVEELPTHGGSIRIYARHERDATKPVTERMSALKAVEHAKALDKLEGYVCFAEQVKETKRALLEFLITARRQGKTVAGYGAPGKGNTLLNYCGIRSDFIDYTVDRNPYKHGKFLPGTHIPIHEPSKIWETRPDYLFVLPWNFKDEIMRQMSAIRSWGGKFVVPIPEVTVCP